MRSEEATPPACRRAELSVGDQILRDRYRLIEQITTGDIDQGLPALWRVSDSASIGFAKIWRDDPSLAEVKSIWTHEVRSLLRLGGLPHAGRAFVRLRELGDDPAGFVVVLESEGREPLASLLSERSRHAWLADIRSPRTRRRLWQGLAKVARGLTLMHAEGTLHRRLDPHSIFSDIEGECDFRLSGFEWSLRVAPGSADELADNSDTTVEAPEIAQPAMQYSVASDWFAFGLLCARLICGAEPPQEGTGRLAELRKAVERSGVFPPERRLIVDLIDPDQDKRTWHASEIGNALVAPAHAVHDLPCQVPCELLEAVLKSLGSSRSRDERFEVRNNGVAAARRQGRDELTIAAGHNLKDPLPGVRFAWPKVPIIRPCQGRQWRASTTLAGDLQGRAEAGRAPGAIFSELDDKGFKYKAAIPLATKPDGKPDLGGA